MPMNVLRTRERIMADLLSAQDDLRQAVEKHPAGSRGQLDAVDSARLRLDRARANLAALNDDRANARRGLRVVSGN